MSDAPERITARYYANGIISARRAGEDWAFSLGDALGQAGYIVTDLSDALDAAAYEAAAGVGDRYYRKAMERAETLNDGEQDRHEECASTAGSIAHAIRALTPAAAQAALDARDARIRWEERERCAKVAEGFGWVRAGQEIDADFVGDDIATAIRAMGDE